MMQQKNKKLFVFEMDNIFLNGQFIDACADKFVFDEELASIRRTEVDPAVLIKKTAKLFCGLSKQDLLAVMHRITLIRDTADCIQALQRQGHIAGIISNSYQFAVDEIKNKSGANFGIGNRLQFEHNIATGDIAIPAYFYYHHNKNCQHTYCKTNALVFCAERYNIPLTNTVAVGAAFADMCIIRQSGAGIACSTTDVSVRRCADTAIDHLSAAAIIDIEKRSKKAFTN